MSRLLHNDVPGLDAQHLADRVAGEIQNATSHRGTNAQPSPLEIGDAIVASSMTVPSDASAAAADTAPPAPLSNGAPSAVSSAPAGESWLQTLRRRSKETEQAIHLWLYRHKYLKEEVARIRTMVEEANGRLIALDTDHRRVSLRQDELHNAIVQAYHALHGVSDQVNARINQIASDHSALLFALERDLSVLQGDVLFQRRRLARLADGLPPQDATGGPPAPLPEPTGGVDAMYVGFEERFRGPWQEIKERLRPHVERLRARRPMAPGKPLLDIGCGRGEWLELVGEAGIEAYGIDSNANAVAACERRGLPARRGDALAHLASLPDGALGAISVFHVIEHLPTAALLRLLDEARRTLIPGGLLMLETPNPESIKVGATTFHTDPTHLRPIPPQLAEFLVDRCGFIDIEVLRLNPYPESAFIREDTEAARRINELMYGPQDYAVIAQRA